MPRVTGPTYDPDAQLFFNAESSAGVSLTTTQKNAVNQWVVDAKAIGIWTKMKAVYPMVGGTATAHKFNLKNPADTNAAFRLSFVGGWTHSSTGITPNGTNAYANTFLTPSANFNNTTFNHLSYYSRTDSAVAFEYAMGSAATGSMAIIIRRDTNLGFGFADYASGTTYRGASGSVTNSLGLFTFSQKGTTAKLFKNTTTVASNTFAASNLALSTNTIILGAVNDPASVNGYTNKQCAFSTIGDGLTDLESQLFYQITEKYQVALGRNVNALQSFYYNPAYNNETNAFLFSTQITDTTTQVATNTLVTDLKTAGVYTKMKALYPMVGGTATTHKFNLVNPQDTDAAFRLSFVGGWTHSASGALPNGTNAYADTFLSPIAVTTLNNIHISYYSRTDILKTNDLPIGSCDGAGIHYTLIALRNTYALLQQTNLTNYPIYSSDPNSLGFYVAARTSSSSSKLYKNNAIVATATGAPTGQPSRSFYLGATNINTIYYSNKQCAFASIGDGLNDAEALAYYNAVNTFQTALSRQV